MILVNTTSLAILLELWTIIVKKTMESVLHYLRNENTRERIVSLILDNIALYRGITTSEKLQRFSGLVYNRFVAECVQNNQYVSLSNKTIQRVNELYRELAITLRALSRDQQSREMIRTIVTAHRDNLITALEENEYDDMVPQVLIPCAEYSANFQFDLLRLTDLPLLEPILDIGCGAAGSLCALLRRRGLREVYGLDQYVSNRSFIQCGNWLEYSFQKNIWGTLIAHMSFTNHFRRTLIQEEPQQVIYRKKYLEILDSLRPGGTFVYTPVLPDIEETLDGSRFTVTRFENLQDRNLDTVHVRKQG